MADDTLSDLSFSEIPKLKVPDLKKELKLRGLSTTGNKNELVERLQAAIKSSDAISADSVDDLDEDLLNDDDDEHLGTDIVVEEEDHALDDIPTKPLKRKISESETNKTEKTPPKKVILNRNITSQVDSNDKPTSEEKKENVNENKTEEKKIIKLSELSAKERLEMRAKKFGAPVGDDLKKAARAERFGNATNGNSNSAIKTTVNTSIDVLKQRAERFGGSVSTIMSKVENQEKLEKRKARFGAVANSNGSLSDSDKAKQRLERFKQPLK